MNYFFFIEAIILFYLLVVTRHSYKRALFFTHIFQQQGYKLPVYKKWCFRNFSDVLIAPPHLFVIPLFVFELIKGQFTITSIAIIIAVFGIFSFGSTAYINPEKQKKPLVFTPRVKRLLGISTIAYAFIVYIGLSLGYFNDDFIPDPFVMSFVWIMGDILVPFIVLLAGHIVKPVENYIQEGFKKKARAKIASMTHLKIIAITGSYGKTSTKFILKTLLEERYNVCFTPGSFNTPMGICKVINNDLMPHHQLLILEMGARHPGNIRELCGIAAPHVSLVTNVGKAHLETFGSVQNIAKTKAEILAGLRQNGTAVLNSDDPLVNEMPVRNDISVIKAGLETGSFQVSNIRYGTFGCKFDLSEGNESVEISTSLLGEHNIRNIVQCIATARYFDLRLPTIAQAAKRIEPVEHRLQLKHFGNYTIIDDAFNSNPTGAKNAVDVLSSFENARRIIVTPGMVELGEQEYEENKQLGYHIGTSSIDLVFLIGKDRSKPLVEGLKEAEYPDDQIKVVNSFFDARDWLEKNHLDGDVILYENDLPDLYNEN